MLNAPEIAGSSARLSCLVMGTNDLVKELHAEHTETRAPVATALGLCMLAARACKLSILDGVYNAIKDEDGLRASCIQGREMGFDGKTLIHPAQIAVTNEVFAPSESDLALANRYVEAPWSMGAWSRICMWRMPSACWPRPRQFQKCMAQPEPVTRLNPLKEYTDDPDDPRPYPLVGHPFIPDLPARAPRCRA
jgi:hypothetical protein